MTFPQPPETSIDQKLAAFDAVPLFMKSLPEDSLNDPVISALQSLVYDGTPDGKNSSYAMSPAFHIPQQLHKISRSREMTTSKANGTARPLVSIHKA